jgi:undecaprenyl-diphosphatase
MLNFQIFISTISGTEIMFALSIILACILYYKNYKKDFYKIFFTSTTAMCITFALKYILKIPRPAHMLIMEDGYRFPSGHAAMASVVMSLGIYYAYTKVKNKDVRQLIYMLSVGWFILVSYSRLYLQVHYPVDILASLFIGIFTTYFVIKVFHHLHYYAN